MSETTRQAYLTPIRSAASGFGLFDSEEPMSYEDTYNILESSDWFFVDGADFVKNSPHGKIHDQAGAVVAIKGKVEGWVFYTLLDPLNEVSHFANEAADFEGEWE